MDKQRKGQKRQSLEATPVFPPENTVVYQMKRTAIYHCFYSPPSCSKGVSGEMEEKNKGGEGGEFSFQ